MRSQEVMGFAHELHPIKRIAELPPLRRQRRAKTDSSEYEGRVLGLRSGEFSFRSVVHDLHSQYRWPRRAGPAPRRSRRFAVSAALYARRRGQESRVSTLGERLRWRTRSIGVAHRRWAGPTVVGAVCSVRPAVEGAGFDAARDRAGLRAGTRRSGPGGARGKARELDRARWGPGKPSNGTEDGCVLKLPHEERDRKDRLHRRRASASWNDVG